MHELMKQVQMMDRAIERWEQLKVELGEVGNAIPSDTRTYLQQVLDELAKEKATEVERITKKYQSELEEKFNAEKSLLEQEIKRRYQEVSSKVVMSLLTSMHEVK